MRIKSKSNLIMKFLEKFKVYISENILKIKQINQVFTIHIYVLIFFYLGLKGWVMNTPQNTVVGTVQGDEMKAKEMENWLRNVGSPQSKITKLEIQNKKYIDQIEFSIFEIKR
ncbi:hypothetical protein IMG5_000970 [Ichthyophthirius multifiliis]|uniref:acylphosphatase n=1 Tax=Ichthyophthirius multifiliis TaxID=5932 RepID=G0QIY4_ICHMU|nr:hypothetical protein IMG5_000970 [Ichthyophthirius multifiliis]EGR34869.1 hypothetical protein IMG5_000970 [Ichthyophthirius multifiliis]|eukprot:XP_004040173.1 hypothetical protein IMG5_000970 [Ichthyophthirius multifiliis]